jgi:hypothetical protein
MAAGSQVSAAAWHPLTALGEYIVLMGELLLARRRAGGDLPEHEESRYVERLEAVWSRMSDAEREEAWRRLTGAPESAPEPT